MTTRTVISRTRRPIISGEKEFAFTHDTIRALENNADIPVSLRNYHSNAWDIYQKLSLPTTTEEAWRRTDIRGLNPGLYSLPDPINDRRYSTPPRSYLKSIVGKNHGGQIVLLPDRAKVKLDPMLSKNGVIFTDFRTAEREHGELMSKLIGRVVRPDEGKFAAMASALAQDGVFVYVPRGVVVDEPLHSVLWGPGMNLAYITHLVVWVEDGASLTYVHEAASPTEPTGQTFHTGLVEIHVGREAKLDFVELQSWGDHVWNFSHERARVERNGTLDWTFGAIGSHLTKNFSDMDLIGEGAIGKMSGFYFVDGNQHLDHDTQQNHLAPHTTSDLLFKGALKGNSRSVWQGMIYVAPGAQKTDGYQANRNLVLSSGARADSIPGLEILADDVRCTHGATVGRIDEEQIFYLRSRGIPYEDAERLIVEGFFDPIMQRIPFIGVRERFQTAIIEKMR